MRNNAQQFESNSPTGLRSEDETTGIFTATFQAACHKGNLRVIQALLQDLSKKEAVALLRSEFPHRSKSWFERNLKYLMSMDLDDFFVFFTHLDPTATTAIRNLSRQNTNHGVSPTRLAFSM